MPHCKALMFPFVLLSAATAAASAEPPVARPDGEFFEAQQADVAVSGSVIVGVASTNAQEGAVVSRLLVTPAPAPPEGRLCLTVLSRDGVYYSRNTFALPDDPAGSTVQLDYSHSKLLETLRRYRERELAIRATPGRCEGVTGAAYYVVDAAASHAPSAVRVFVNSFGATDVFFQRDSPADAVACAPITEGRRTSFDYWCDIPWPTGAAGPFTVHIQRERYGREMPGVALTLYPAPRP